MDRENAKKIKDNDSVALDALFYKLFRQLPKATKIFCAIDSITFYERLQTTEEFFDAIEMLMRVFEDCEHVVFKLLLTCHGRSAFIRVLQKDDWLTLPMSVSDDGQGLNENSLEAMLGEMIEGSVSRGDT